MDKNKNKLFYEKYSGVLREMISDQIVHLAKIDKEYKKMQEDISKIKEQNPKMEKLYDGKIIELSKEDCKDLQNIINLQYSMRIKEDKAIFYLGGGEVIRYLKKIEEFNKISFNI